jgi:hypothetical protein
MKKVPEWVGGGAAGCVPPTAQGADEEAVVVKEVIEVAAKLAGSC